jgi:hypothetical protein
MMSLDWNSKSSFSNSNICAITSAPSPQWLCLVSWTMCQPWCDLRTGYKCFLTDEHMNWARSFWRCCRTLYRNPVSPILATYNMLPTEKKSRFVQVWQEWSKGKRLQIRKTHQLQEIHNSFFVRSNTHRLWKQILTSSMFGLTEFQAPATIKFRSVRWSQTCMHR